jgi:hypothetical protein
MNDSANLGNGNDGISSAKEDTIEIKIPGIFTRAKNALQAHPITTSVVTSVGVVAGAVGGLNYRNYGTVLPLGPRADVAGRTVEAGVRAARSFLVR